MTDLINLTPTLGGPCPNRYLWARLGEHHLWKWEGPEQLFRVTDFFPHPGFNSDLSAHDHNHDIMLIRLPRNARLGSSVTPLNLSRTCVSPGTECLISGWGAVSSPKGTASFWSTPDHSLVLRCPQICVILAFAALPVRLFSHSLCFSACLCLSVSLCLLVFLLYLKKNPEYSSMTPLWLSTCLEQP